MIELFVDFETTGLPNHDEELDHESQPHIMEMGLVKRVDRRIVAAMSTLVKCPVASDDGAFKVHGLTQEMTQYGIEPIAALGLLQSTCAGIDRWISHNVALEQAILDIATARAWDQEQTSEILLPKSFRYCTMNKAKPFFENRPPKLIDALRHFATYEQWDRRKPLHTAMGDVEACMIVYDGIERKSTARLDRG